MAQSARIAVIGGDGIGPEVLAEAVKVLRAAVADLTAAILSAAMLCDHLGMASEASRIEQAVAEYLLERQGEWAARSTADVGDHMAERVSG